MPLRLHTPALSAAAQRGARHAQADLTTALTRLASGLRINGARDDAAGLAVAQRVDTQVRGLQAAQRNVNDGISLAQVAEGALGAIAGNLQRMRELAVQAANATNAAPDRVALQREVAQLLGEIDRIATDTAFNGSRLLDGSYAAQSIQIGADLGQRVTMPTLADAHTSTLGTWAGFTVQGLQAPMPPSTPGELVVDAGGVTYNFGIPDPDSRAVVAAFNSGKVPGLSATLNPTVVPAGTSTSHAVASGTATLTINGTAIAIAGIAGADALGRNPAAAVGAINAHSAATGVTAIDTGSGVSLHAADGCNIVATYAAGTFVSSTKADFGLANGPASDWPVAASINLRYVAPPGVGGIVYYYHEPYWYSGGWVAAQGTPIAKIDIGSAAGASAALESIDVALQTVDASRAALGAVQNRYAAAARNLGVAGENLTATRSRIADADYALETAKRTRAEMLQAASTAMLAQANQTPLDLIGLLL